ncbi:MAG: hypothetical protein KatS3mg068_0136 [Candidatus Sericytochromatia bacterium]|nr:MAG: hypothetical protein KatS3mg068_0136 [Candidatus Sericytochromatia bacterium]
MIINVEKSLNKNKLSSNELLLSLINHSLKNSYSFALWKEPYSNDKNFIIDTSNNLKKEKVSFRMKGFCFSPFQIENTNLSYILRPDFLMLNNKVVNNNLDLNLIELLLEDSLYKYTDKINQEKFFEKCKKEDFIFLVNKVLAEIDNSNLNKVVISRIKEKKLPKNFSPLQLFNLLCAKYNDSAFIYIFFSPELGFWLGATPELLLGLENNKIKTMSLASTQSYYEGIDLENIKWSDKEIEEQKYVSIYIKDALKKINVENYSEVTRNIVAGSVIHLRTLFEFDSNKPNQYASKLLKMINPTPAVLGTPVKEALSFILENELHKREFYCGFLGPLNIEKNKSNLYVNLRCLQFYKDIAYLYVGAGILKGSIPEKEWMETELKSQTLLSVIESMI